MRPLHLFGTLNQSEHAIFNLATCLQERLTAKEAMAHPYFAPVRQREGTA